MSAFTITEFVFANGRFAVYPEGEWPKEPDWQEMSESGHYREAFRFDYEQSISQAKEKLIPIREEDQDKIKRLAYQTFMGPSDFEQWQPSDLTAYKVEPLRGEIEYQEKGNWEHIWHRVEKDEAEDFPAVNCEYRKVVRILWKEKSESAKNMGEDFAKGLSRTASANELSKSFFSRDANRLEKMFEDSNEYVYFIENKAGQWLLADGDIDWTSAPDKAMYFANYYKAYVFAAGLKLNIEFTITEHLFIDKPEEDDFLTNPTKQLESLLRRTWLKAGGSYRDPAMNKWIKDNQFLFDSIIQSMDSAPSSPQQTETQEELWKQLRYDLSQAESIGQPQDRRKALSEVYAKFSITRIKQ